METNIIDRLKSLTEAGHDLLSGVILNDESCNIIAKYVKENDIFIKF